MGRKVSFAVVFTDINRREALPVEISIHTAEMTAIKEALRNGVDESFFGDDLAIYITTRNQRWQPELWRE